jgi:hypothetical protein
MAEQEKWKRGTYPTSSLVVVKVHELTSMAECPRFLSALPLTDVDEILSKPGQWMVINDKFHLLIMTILDTKSILVK